MGIRKIHHAIADNGIVNENNYWSSHWHIYSTIIVTGISEHLCGTVDDVHPDTAWFGCRKRQMNEVVTKDRTCQAKLTQHHTVFH